MGKNQAAAKVVPDSLEEILVLSTGRDVKQQRRWPFVSRFRQHWLGNVHLGRNPQGTSDRRID